jgi:hypothetical protein
MKFMFAHLFVGSKKKQKSSVLTDERRLLVPVRFQKNLSRISSGIDQPNRSMFSFNLDSLTVLGSTL